MKKYCLMLLGVVVLSVSAFADLRPYAFTYPYQTIRQGYKEIEIYTDYITKGKNYSVTNQLELEYGITESWMASLYGVFSGTNTTTSKYVQTKLSTRYRIGEAGQYIVDPALYLEYKANTDGSSKIEFKQILSKDLDEYNVTLNLKAEKALTNTTSWDTGYTIGIGKSILQGLKAGIEARGDFAGRDSAQYIGPSVEWLFGVGKINFVAAVGSTSSSQDYYFRSIIAFLI